MTKPKKAKQSNLITRSKAIRSLGVSLSQFRFLTILSGVYPTVPHGKNVDKDKIYYSKKDIKFIRNGPLMVYLGDYKIYLKHRRHALTDGDTLRAESLKKSEPKLPIAQILKSRFYHIFSPLYLIFIVIIIISIIFII